MEYLDVEILRGNGKPVWSARPSKRPLLIDETRIEERMTPRELDVFARMAAGLSNRQIAADLGIGYTTVRGHVQSVLEKLGARSRFDAVARAYRGGLVRVAEREL